MQQSANASLANSKHFLRYFTLLQMNYMQFITLHSTLLWPFYCTSCDMRENIQRLHRKLFICFISNAANPIYIGQFLFIWTEKNKNRFHFSTFIADIRTFFAGKLKSNLTLFLVLKDLKNFIEVAISPGKKSGFERWMRSMYTATAPRSLSSFAKLIHNIWMNSQEKERER